MGIPKKLSINAKKCLFWFDDLRSPLSIEPSGLAKESLQTLTIYFNQEMRKRAILNYVPHISIIY